ncbi:sulfate ABC transporter permease subunit CysT [Phormidium tenue]|uniref:Sulfate transport system permease protein CysT n=1 Tax=Phormidium tenue NIES-30 TaxID=549789 RepID=A0A1U7IZA5_9CYAN|nr:sulfate ABC transporter permease subunit CysT [Phormidium tenue]MBD2234506.1 sulfate ABC transporter permease subunit CysT [Phormidium tenue FACHB-1052]OKH44406.1 sulfate ABC transporter permease subunit CysT [Phormidium tenue NIES-30]
MTSSPPSSSPGLWHQIVHASWTWRVTWLYLTLFLLLPMAALVLKALTLNPAEIWRIATDPVAISTYNVTFFTALVASIINGFAGLIIAWVLVRYEFPGKRFLDAIIDLPFALPTAVAGLTLSTIYSSNGLIGGFLEPFGIKVSFTRLGVLVAMIFIALPFSVRTVQPVLQDMESEMEEAAWSMGASQWQTFWRVILPPLMPAILTGVAMGFSRAVGEYGSVVIIAGNIPFQDLIAPVLIIQRLEQFDYAGATVVGTVLLLISLSALLVINLIQARGRRFYG